MMRAVPSQSVVNRRALRRAVDMPCEVITQYVDQPLLYWATDLSPYGMWIDTPAPMRMGEVVVVSFRPAVWWSSRELTVFAEVTRVSRTRGSQLGVSGMGVEFTDLSAHEQRALAGWLRNRPPPLPRRKARAMSERSLPLPRCLLAA